jgi:hypothetical protein
MSDIWSLRPSSIPSRPREPNSMRSGGALRALVKWKRRRGAPSGLDRDRKLGRRAGRHQPSRGDEHGAAACPVPSVQVNSGIGRDRGIPIRFTLS